MRLQTLSIKDYRGLNFTYNFSDNNFIVLTGVNGSGKSTIIEAVNLLLSQQTNSITEQFANQITSETAEFEISILAEEGEIEYLAEKLEASEPNQVSKEQFAEALREKIFINGVYKRRIVVVRPVLGWRQGDPVSVQDYVNDSQVNGGQQAFDTLVSANHFNTIGRQILLKFEQLESINLQLTHRGRRGFSIQDIFSNNEGNPGQRISRTNLSASPLLDSLVKYNSVDDSKLWELIHEYEQILDPIQFDIVDQVNGMSHIALTRDGKSKYTIDSASSGQKKAIVLATLKYIWKSAALKPIVLLDEPENSMHPELTSRIFQSLNELVSGEEQEPSFIIATHSAEIVAANADNTFRIITDEGQSTLSKIRGLEDRAAIMRELGVKFTLDYVAQKIVFVEGTEDGNRQGIGDEEAYQTLIDPMKERVFFVGCGSKKVASQRHVFQRELMRRLDISDALFDLMTDRDEKPEDEDNNTPFWDVEYMYVANPELLSECTSDITGQSISVREITALNSGGSNLEDIRTKDIWMSFVRQFSIPAEQACEIQRVILRRLRENSQLRTEPITQLIDRFNSIHE